MEWQPKRCGPHGQSPGQRFVRQTASERLTGELAQVHFLVVAAAMKRYQFSEFVRGTAQKNLHLLGPQ